MTHTPMKAMTAISAQRMMRSTALRLPLGEAGVSQAPVDDENTDERHKGNGDDVGQINPNHHV